ncbi:hypothetical protein ACP70R_015840 [Stipagrostis hirtigluma subsp. patula]
MEGGGVEAPDGVVIDPVRRPEARRRFAAWGGVDDELEDAVCALCSDGGLLIGLQWICCASIRILFVPLRTTRHEPSSCEGPCLRFFHATREADDYSGCSTLGFTTAQVQAIQHFFCTNCVKKQHRCAGCGVLGSSDAANAQVFRCSHVNCGRFYHPACISAQLHPEDPLEAARCKDQVAAGVVFECQRPHRAGYDF